MQNTLLVNYRSKNQLFFYHQSISVLDAPQNVIVPHSHPHYEIIYLNEGNAELVVEGKLYRLQSGDILVIRPNEHHSIKSNDPVYKRCVISFEKTYLQDFPNAVNDILQPYVEPKTFDGFIPCHTVKTLRLDEYFHKINDELSSPNVSELYISIRLLSLLIEINGYIFSESAKKNTSYYNTIIDNIIKYIDENISKKITLDNLEKHVNLSKYYISHLFKKTMGITLSNYIIEKKIRHAEQLIRQGVQPTKASLMVGYSNYPNFYENYKKITKTTPKDTTVILRVNLE